MVEFSNLICATEPPCSAPLHLQQLCRKKGRHLPFTPLPHPYPSQFPHPHPLNHRSAMLTLISKLFILHPHTLTLSIPCLPHPLNLTPLFNPYPLTLAKLPALCPLNLTTTLESPPQPLKVPKYCPLSH